MNTEWDLVKAIATANNTGDRDGLYKLVAENDFTGKSQAIHAALASFYLTAEEINKYRSVLTDFVNKYDNQVTPDTVDMRTCFRMAYLAERLIADEEIKNTKALVK
ncbi:hypothetical protein I3271_05515 [Photobacterium leiognathi]|uniref:hypothetical protein n=1 Tax=Photobacterium leiognathi TaxID=553611 RepID=UPI001EDCC26D|nr:hypothetical protein [Photobacterium leiognathi]MCG3884139.1 hypothetical protein [Photobacterium leiognathi]